MYIFCSCSFSIFLYFVQKQISDDVHEGGAGVPEDPFAGAREGKNTTFLHYFKHIDFFNRVCNFVFQFVKGQKKGGKSVVQILTILLDDTNKNLKR